MSSSFYPYINIHTHKHLEGEVTIQCVGVHPYLSEKGIKLSENDITSSTEAIGEIGLDYSRPLDRELQEELFSEQLTIAQRAALPVVIHSVRAVDRTLEILKCYSLKAVIFHGFIGSEQQASRAISRGYYLSFGDRCFASNKTLIALRNSPITNIFFETDDKDISIEEIYRLGVAQRVESLEVIKEQLYKNYKKIFNK